MRTRFDHHKVNASNILAIVRVPCCSGYLDVSQGNYLGNENTERREHSHASVLDLGLAPLLDVAGGGAVGEAEGVEDLR